MKLPRVLVVDDTPQNLLAIESILSDGVVDVVTASSGSEALKATLTGDFALILLDVEMPGMNGYEAAALLRSNSRTREIPIIFVTATHGDKHNIFLGYESGAVDYILKPLDAHALKSKVKVFADLYGLKEREKANVARKVTVEEHAKLNTILDNVSVGVIMVEPPEGQVVFINRQLPWMRLADVQQIYGLNGERIEVEDQVPARVLRGELVHDDESTMILKDGTKKHFLVSGVPIRDVKGNVTSAVVSFLDVTVRVAAEEARESARAQLQLAYKMSALGEMAGGIAHEVNNPLAIILGRARQLREEANSDKMDKAILTRFATQIEETTHRVVKIVNGLRTISRSSDRDPCVVTPLTPLIDGTIAICQAKFKYQSIGLHLEVTPDLAIECRAAEISQVLLNLIGNALDAIEASEEKWVRISARDAGDAVEIAVEDSGPGVSADVKDRIMQPFFTTKEVGKGTGLGLSISKGIVEAHGGSFHLDEAGKNTRFVARLPKRQDQSAPAPLAKTR